jgi:hypothetical protein
MTIDGGQAKGILRHMCFGAWLCAAATPAGAQPAGHQSCSDIFRINLSSRLDAVRHRAFSRVVTDSFCRSFRRVRKDPVDGDPTIDFTQLIKERGARDKALETLYFRSCYAGSAIADHDLVLLLGATAAPEVFEAYSRCMARKENAPGLQIEIIDPADSRFAVAMRWNRDDSSEKGVVQQIETGSARCAPIIVKPGLPIAGEWVVQPCMRSDTNPVRIQLEVRAASTSVRTDAHVPRVFAPAHGSRGSACEDTVAVVGTAYRQLLTEDADPAGLARHVERLEAGIETVQDLIRSLAISSTFHRQIIAPALQTGGMNEALRAAYSRILGRELDPDAAKAQPAAIRDAGWAKILASLVASPEYRSAFQTDTVPYAREAGAKPVKFCW